MSDPVVVHSGQDGEIPPRPVKWVRRVQRFIELRLPDAEELADRLADRDADLDDRRLCVECRHHRHSGCAVRGAWFPRTFQRCEAFAAAPLAGEAA